MTRNYIIVAWDASGEFYYHGPFAEHGAALAYAETHDFGTYEIAELETMQ